MSIRKEGVVLSDLEVWKLLGGPKRSDQWVPGRSALEVARAWLGTSSPRLPPEIETALGSHPDFDTCEEWTGEPEVQLRFDDFAGEPRNTDLLVEGRDSNGAYLLAVEAKADEPFADLVSETWSNAIERRIENPRSNGVNRINGLVSALLPPRAEGTARAGDLRYQLLTAAAGAIAEGERRGARRIVLLVHEFVTDRTDDLNHDKNARDLDRFVARVSGGRLSAVRTGTIVGPIVLPRAALNPLQFYVGKASRNLRTGLG